MDRFKYLVEAALRAETTSEAWKKYRAALDTQTPGSGEARLYPLVAENLRKSRGTSKDPLIVAAQRTAIAQGEVMLRAAEYANRILRNKGIEVIFVKGVALQIAEFRDPSLRTFSDIDCCIHPNDIPAVMQIAQEEGWENYKNFAPHNPHVVSAHAEMTFQLPSGVSLDVHWTPRRVFSFQPELLENFFQTTETVTFRGQTWRIPSVNWRLMETLEHGMEANSVAPIRWVTDAVRQLENPNNQHDWDWIATAAQTAKIEYVFQKALSHLAEFSTSVSDAELSRFAGHPGILEKWEFRHRMRDSGGNVERLWREFLHFFLRAQGNLLTRSLSFPSYLIQGAGRSERAIDLVMRVLRHNRTRDFS